MAFNWTFVAIKKCAKICFFYEFLNELRSLLAYHKTFILGILGLTKINNKKENK